MDKFEALRRCDALASATVEMTLAERDYEINGELASEPFECYPWKRLYGDVNVIYDRNGRVDHVVTHEGDE